MSATRTQDLSDSRPLASVSLDVDNLWSYMKIHGDDGWQSRPSYLDTLIPYSLEVLDRLDAKITYFVVGVDAADPKNHAALKQIVPAGHEIGNHSLEHEPWLHLYSEQELRHEIHESHQAIISATGVTPRGFRGPGFSWSPTLLKVLHDHGYAYDASTLPTFLGPIARAYYFWSANLSKEEREKRKELFGKFADGMRPVKPYYWDLGSQNRLLEIPVTTMPIFRTPFHFSYLAYLANYSKPLMYTYLHMAMTMCRLTGTRPSFLLHPLDMMGGDKAPELSYFPGMDLSSEKKTALLMSVMKIISRHFRIVPMGEHARQCEQQNNLALRPVA